MNPTNERLLIISASILFALVVIFGSRQPVAEVVAECDPEASPQRAAGLLQNRISAGVPMTECDVQNIKNIDWALDNARRQEERMWELEEEITACQWGEWSAADCCAFQEVGRLEAIVEMLDDCAGSPRPSW